MAAAEAALVFLQQHLTMDSLVPAVLVAAQGGHGHLEEMGPERLVKVMLVETQADLMGQAVAAVLALLAQTVLQA